MNKKYIIGISVAILLIVAFVAIRYALQNSIFADIRPSKKIYVATNGNDKWSGNLAAPNTAGTDGPLKTLAGAQRKIKRIKNLMQFTQPIDVLIKAGKYELSTTLNLNSLDSGTSTNPIKYTTYGDGEVVLSGSKEVSLNWQKYSSSGFYVADLSNISGLPKDSENKTSFNSFFVNGKEATRARTPNIGASKNYNLVKWVDTSSVQSKCQSFYYYPGDINPNWTNLKDVEVVNNIRWLQSRFKINSVSSGKVTVKGSMQGAGWNYQGFCFNSDYYVATKSAGISNPSERYYVENVFEGLDVPGEWYLNRQTNKLYYYPRAGESIDTATFEIPKLERLVNLNGASYLTFSNLTFANTTWFLPSNGFPAKFDIISNVFTYPVTINGQARNIAQFQAAFGAYNASNINVNNNVFKYIGNDALYFLNSRNSVIESNMINNLGGKGILIRSDKITTNDELVRGYASKGQSGNIKISKNTISNIGKNFAYSAAIHAFVSDDNLIENNTVYNAPYIGISSVGLKTKFDGSTIKGNIISKNIVHDVMQVLNDGAGIYSGIGSNDTIEKNRIYNVLYTKNHSVGASTLSSGIVGLYLDNYSSNANVIKNIIYNTEIGFEGCRAINYNFENNVIADTKSVPVWFMCDSKGSGKLSKNIIYHPSKDFPTFRYLNNLNNGSTVSEKNLYYPENSKAKYYKPQPKYIPHLIESNYKYLKNKFSNLEKNSKIANPLFIDPANGNYKVSSKSPAIALGFVNIDEETPDNPAPTPPDNQAPIIKNLNLRNNNQAKEINVSANITDDKEISKVLIYANNKQLGEMQKNGTSQYRYTIQKNTCSNNCKIKVTAYDNENLSASASKRTKTFLWKAN